MVDEIQWKTLHSSKQCSVFTVDQICSNGLVSYYGIMWYLPSFLPSLLSGLFAR
jgi:hypothetical protein